VSPKQRPFDHHLSQDDGYDKPDKLGDQKVGYDSRTEEKVVIDDTSQSAATSGPTREEAEAWLKTKGVSKDEVELIVIYVFDFGRTTKPSIRAVADAFARRKREWVAKKLRDPAVREFCGIVRLCHNTGKPLPPVGPASGLPQPEEIEEYIRPIKEKWMGDRKDIPTKLDFEASPAGRLAFRLQISHFPDNHPERHRDDHSLIGCAAFAGEMLKPGGLYRDAIGKFVHLKFPRGRLAQFPPGSLGSSSMFSEREFGKEDVNMKGDASGEHVEHIEWRYYNRIAKNGRSTPRSLIDAITAQGVEVPQAITEIERLNQLLSNGNLLDQFKEITLSEEAAWMVRRNLPGQLDEERIRLNRLILEAAFPKLCPRNRYIRFLGRALEAEDIVPLIRMNPSWLLQGEWTLLLEAFVDLLEGAFYGDSVRRVPGIVHGGSRKRVSNNSNDCLNDLVEPQPGNAYNYDNDSLSQILDKFILRVQDLQTEWKIVKQRPAKITKQGLLEKFRDAHGRELQCYSFKRLKIILTDNPRVVAAGLASDVTGLDESVFRRAQEKAAKQPGGPTGFCSPYSLYSV
jgi:hypothetical protein